MWTFPLSCYELFKKAIEDAPGVTLNSPLPPWIVNIFLWKEAKPLNQNGDHLLATSHSHVHGNSLSFLSNIGARERL